jgi:uncharacterized membrane protein (UPF0127 family)
MAWLVCDDRVLASAEIRTTSRERARGLLGRDGIDGAIVLRPCRWIHTVGMRFALDIAYVDRAGNVLHTVRMRPNRMGMPRPRAGFVVEAEAGAFGRWGLHVGDVLELRD